MVLLLLLVIGLLGAFVHGQGTIPFDDQLLIVRKFKSPFGAVPVVSVASLPLAA
jgi:hypothetical protein